MTWQETFQAVWDVLVSKVSEITTFEKRVYYGEKFPPDMVPAAFVCPVMAESTPKTFKESTWVFIFDIGLAVENEDAKAGMIAAWGLAGQIVDLLEIDRTLGDVIHNLECGPIVPYWRRLGRGTKRHWVGVTVNCIKKM